MPYTQLKLKQNKLSDVWVIKSLNNVNVVFRHINFPSKGKKNLPEKNQKENKNLLKKHSEELCWR